MTWWGWAVIGTLLLCAELFAIDAQFYLIFIGAGAIIVGLIGLAGIDLPVWAQWLLFAVLSIIAMVTVRRQLYEKLRLQPTAKLDTDVNRRVLIPQDLAPGRSGRVEYRGSGWTAVNVGDQVIPAGSEVRIESIDGLTLNVRMQ
jgi:membrane protein implicated in regulation of membrane protease activity